MAWFIDSIAGEGPRFRNGEFVEVRTKEEILASLDENGELDSLPFMPEMLKYCGQRVRVYRQAHRLCDTAEWTGFHRMREAVHLEDARCDGSAHGGCQAGCLLYWKEAWLKPVEETSARDVTSDERLSGISEAQLDASTCTSDGSDVKRYRCQATELVRAAPERIPWWDPAAYVRDIRSGNADLFPVLRGIFVMLFNFFQRANEKFLPRVRLIYNAEPYPFIRGRLRKTPKSTLNLQAGELVRIKSRDEILSTLDEKSRNRGLSFDAEMLKYCGREARVLRRVDRIIDEATGVMQELPTDCIILEGVVCAGDYNRYCPRSIYPYWREIWLERVESSMDAGSRAGGLEAAAE
jgi:hypothetical protein